MTTTTNEPDRKDALEALFNAETVAVIGASSDPLKIGGRPINYLQRAGYAGTIVPVNPTQPEIAGLPAYASLTQYDGPVDLALILVSADRVEAAVRDCVAKRVPVAVIFSAGFAELGEEGRLAQERIRDLARAGDLRLVGPNCMGVMNFGTGMLATFAGALVTELPKPGRLAIASQSGAVGSHCMLLARERGLGLSKVVTTGNEIDVDIADCLLALAADPDTDAIIGYLEGATDGDRLRAGLEAVRASGKPIALLKGGASAVGATAALSHTASLAGADAVYDELLKRYGVYRAATLDELLGSAYAFTMTRLRPSTTDVVVTSLGPGTGSLTRVLEGAGLTVRHTTATSLADALAVPTDGATQVVAAGALAVAPDVHESLAAAPSAGDDLRIVWGSSTPASKAALEALGHLVVEDERILAPVLAAMRLAHRDRAADEVASGPPSDAVRGLISDRMTEPESMDLLDALGVATPARAVVTDADQAVAAAERIGYPVVLKIVSPDIQHKSDVGGVALRLTDADVVRAAFERVVSSSRAAVPDARIDGVMVTSMLAGGIEMIIGMQRDPVFGPVVICGVGGTLVEVFGDVALRLTPLSRSDVDDMLGQLRQAPGLDALMSGYDVGALGDLLHAFAAAAHGLGDVVDSLEINPVLVLPDGSGCVALDALVVTREAAANALPTAGGHH